MDVVEKISSRFVKETMPMIEREAYLAYCVSLVIMAVKTTDKSWHKKNLFFSYLKALLYVKGAALILALCTGASPIKELACNKELLTIGVIWWLVLFCPFNLFNNILQVDVGDLKPVLLLINLLTILKQVALVNAAVNATLEAHPGSYIAIFTGTIAGNGCLVVSGVFGDFARAISNHKMTTTAFVTALFLTLTNILCPKALGLSAPIVLTFCAALMFFLELLEAFDMHVSIFDPIYTFVQRIVVTCDLFDA